MSLKQVLWTSSTKSSFHTFVYYETNSEIWWCLPSLFSFCEVTGSSTKVFGNYQMKNVFKKTFGEFQPTKKFISNQTSLVSTETALTFLKKWNEKQKSLDSKTFGLLEKLITAPQGTLVEQRMVLTKKKLAPTLKITKIRSESQETLIRLVRTSLTFSLVAQEILQEKKPVSSDDINLLTNYIFQLQEYLADLRSPAKTAIDPHDFIDIEVNETN